MLDKNLRCMFQGFIIAVYLHSKPLEASIHPKLNLEKEFQNKLSPTSYAEERFKIQTKFQI